MLLVDLVMKAEGDKLKVTRVALGYFIGWKNPTNLPAPQHQLDSARQMLNQHK